MIQIHLSLKRMLAFFLDSIHYSERIAIITIIILFQLHLAMPEHQLFVLEAILNTLFGSISLGLYGFYDNVGIIARTIQTGEIGYWDLGDVWLLTETLAIVCVRSFFITYCQIRNQGYSRGGKRMGIKVELENPRYAPFKLFIRNLAIFSGGFMFYFLICIPLFNKGSKSLLDKLLKTRVIECKEDSKKVTSFLNRFVH